MSTTIPSFQASGLASGIDTASIVDQLVSLQSKPIATLQQSQTAIDVQISSIGSLRSNLLAFQTALHGLVDTGAHGARVAQAPAAADVTASPGASAGRTTLEVSQLAQAAKSRSAAQSTSALLSAGTLHIDADGTGYDIDVTDGMSLGDLASAIRASGAPVTANVLNDGTSDYLSVARTTSGFEVGSTPDSALTLSGTTADALGFSTVVTAQNAKLTLDGLAFERRTNEIDDALPGATLSLKQVSTGPEDIVIADDGDQTKASLQKLVDAYNTIVGAVQGELDIHANTDRTKTLGGDPTMRLVQARMQALLTTAVGSTGMRTLADLGLKSDRDGKVTIDDAAFDKAVASDPGAADRILAGLKPAADDLVNAFTDSVNGALTVRSQGLADKKKRVGDQITQLQDRADQYRARLVAQFAAMEKVLSGLKAIGNFLTSQETASKNNGGG